MTLQFDYIIVGGGIAGSVLASRLSAALPESSFLLIEAGPLDDPRVEHTQGYTAGLGGSIEWNHWTVPQKALEGKVVSQVQGRILGGSSAINFQSWTRGASVDFDQWANIVDDQRWSWSGLLPYFKKSEKFFPGRSMEGPEAVSAHGFQGPITVAAVTNSGRPRNYPLREMVAQAYESIGTVHTPDVNSGNVLGYSEAVQSTYDGKRKWAASCYKVESNVTIWVDTVVEKIMFDNNRVTGVQCCHNAEFSSVKHVTARKEVFVCGGVQGSAKLLLLSGIGPHEELAIHQIPQKLELPVGNNYSDHPFFFTSWKLRDRGLSLGDMPLVTDECDWTAGLPGDWMAFHRQEDDIMTVGKRDLDESTIKWLMADGKPHTESFAVYGHLDLSNTGEPNPGGSVLIIGNSLVSPTCRGTLKLQTSNPKDAPLLDPALLSNSLDYQLLQSCGKLTTSMMTGPIGQKYGAQEYGIDEALRGKLSDEAMHARLMKTARTLNHGSGTCAMGSVVDQECRVMGVDGLRVVDASVFPLPIGAHYQAIVYAVTEQMAQIIIDEQRS